MTRYYAYKLLKDYNPETLWEIISYSVLNIFFLLIIAYVAVVISGWFVFAGEVSGKIEDEQYRRICGKVCTDHYSFTINGEKYIVSKHLYDDRDIGDFVRCNSYGWEIDWIDKQLRECKYD